MAQCFKRSRRGGCPSLGNQTWTQIYLPYLEHGMCSTLSYFSGDTKCFWILNWQVDGKKPQTPMKLCEQKGKACRGIFLQLNRIQSSEFSVKIWGIYLGVFPRLDSVSFHLRCFCGQKCWNGGKKRGRRKIKTKQKIPLYCAKPACKHGWAVAEYGSGLQKAKITQNKNLNNQRDTEVALQSLRFFSPQAREPRKCVMSIKL